MYDPKNDVSLQCACFDTEEDYPDGWDEYFKHDLIEQQKAIMASERDKCPRAMVRHAAARLATMIAMIGHASPEKEAVQSVEAMLEEIPHMLKEMTVDAAIELTSVDERPLRGAAAGYRKSLN
jgi:hypothetical protein